VFVVVKAILALPFALTVNGQARWRSSLCLPLTASSLREFSNYERLRLSARNSSASPPRNMDLTPYGQDVILWQ